MVVLPGPLEFFPVSPLLLQALVDFFTESFIIRIAEPAFR